MSAVHPVTDELPAGGGFAPGDLILVVREDVVRPAGVDVEGLAQVLHAHGRALEVPAGSSDTHRRLPERLRLLARLPEDEVANVRFFVLVGVDPEVGNHPLLTEAGQPAVFGERVQSEVYGALAFICV